jgi:DNA repair exonuclease SbcCD ATPase subunit
MTESNQHKPEKRENQRLFYILLTIALLGSWGYIFYDQAQAKKIQTELETKLGSSDSARNALQKEYDAALLRLDELTNMNSSLDSLVKTKDDQLEALKARIQKMLNKDNKTESDLVAAKQLIENLNNQISGYVSEIEKLKGEKLQLENDKKGLITEKDALKKQYDITQEEKAKVEEKLNEASTLFASNINIIALDVRSSGKEVQKTKAKKVDKLRLSFDVYSRAGVESTKELYIIITDPSDKTVFIDNNSSGKLTANDQTELDYTKKTAVNFKPNKFSPVSVEWKPTTRLSGGTYRVFIFNNGYKIGEETIMLK